jgi:hypothetical protein
MAQPKRSKKTARERLASLKEFAAVEFKPWAPQPDGKMLPSTEVMNQIGISARLAYAIMLRTKEQLMDMRKEIGDKTLNKLMSGLQADQEIAKELLTLMRTAELRMLSAFAAAETAKARARKKAA